MIRDLIVVGAGPAGMSAALTAAEHGLDVEVVDEQARAGGQIFRQPPEAFAGSALKPTAGYEWANGLIERFESDTSIPRRFGSTVIGALRGDDGGLQVAVNHPAGGTEVIPTRRLLIATGAYDLPVAFPGWTLPGVMMAGAAQTLVKSQRLVPTGELVLAGAHPLLLVVADLLVSNGATVTEVAFAQGIPSPARMLASLGAVPGHVRMLGEAAQIVARLRRRGVRLSTRTVVTAARGSTSVESVELERVRGDWTRTGNSRTVEAAHLILGYGFSPSSELARQLGCELHYDSPAGGWTVVHDTEGRTSEPDVFVAGEPTGVAGADQSRAEGVRAALGVARSVGKDVPERVLDRAQVGLRHARRFSRVVQQVFAPNRAGLGALATPATTVCRCELVTRGDIDDYLAGSPFVSDVNAVKLSCRTGMGPCQGRYCEGTVAAVLSSARHGSIGHSGRFSAHLPVKPVPVADLQRLDWAEDPAGSPGVALPRPNRD